MDPKELLAKSIQQAATCIQQVSAQDLGNPTPCTEWDMRMLINHMVYKLLWVPELLLGKTVEAVGDRHDGDVLYSDFHTSWQHAADTALVAAKHADLSQAVHLSPDLPAGEYIQRVGADILIHGWDVGRGMHSSLVFDEPLAQAVYDHYIPRREELTASGDYGQPFEPPEGSSLEIKLLALVGRHADMVP